MAGNPSHPHGIDPVQSWNQNAEYWDQGIGASGNKYWSKLQEPCLQKFLGEHLQRENCQALEFATGNGLCARWMAERGARVLATDGAPTMLEKAKGRGSAGGRIEFQKVDVTSDEELDVLVQSGNTFDIILMNMAIMDVATLDPLARALPKLLKKDGVFAATILHPVFMTSIYSRTAESKFDPVTLDYNLQLGKNISEYMFVEPYKTVALIGQEGPQLFFHRPIHELCATFFRAGLVMDGFEEPCFKKEDGDPTRMLSTTNFTQLPAIMGFRMRLMGN